MAGFFMAVAGFPLPEERTQGSRIAVQKSVDAPELTLVRQPFRCAFPKGARIANREKSVDLLNDKRPVCMAIGIAFNRGKFIEERVAVQQTFKVCM
jgi:hypothetical protein